MTTEQLKEAVFLEKQINRIKTEIDIWNNSTHYRNSNIEINYKSSSTTVVSISNVISFYDLREMALKELNKKLDCYNERFNDL